MFFKALLSIYIIIIIKIKKQIYIHELLEYLMIKK